MLDGDRRVPVRAKLSALWASLMLLYVYGDFFGLFLKGRLAEMNRGMIGPLGEATPAILVGVSAMMAVPALMISLVLLLPRAIARWTSVLFGIAYSTIMLLTVLPGAEPFYLFFAAIEIAVSLTIVAIAWSWKVSKTAVPPA